MAGVVEWVKSYSLVFLFMTVLTTAVAKKEYQKYIQIFVEIILVLTLLDPLLELTGRSEDLFEKISYDSFFQGLEEMKKDQAKMDFMDKEAYISYYEKALKEDVALLAESMGYVVTDASVSLNEAYEVEKIEGIRSKSTGGNRDHRFCGRTATESRNNRIERTDQGLLSGRGR